ncbi:SCP-2 sterol transfer family protein [Ancylostoma caninum]|uniref:SCP-2 sterol transfer family protein n=1 Tax=Ancylostoma caninum TaxID=29170 RepID=A0A368FG92_ANCCA|nr:SCP-2 sterol transfer family protein [Ancylostoma caninum]RCN34487.1 SCP-2 sterol transfer family protein [Ancylostoma caninum]
MAVFKSDSLFEEIKDQMQKSSVLAEKVSSSFKITVKAQDGTEKKWFIDAKSRPPYVGNEERPAELELQLKDSDFMNIAAGKLRPDQAFLRGKMKLKGNVGKANRLRTLLKHGTSKSKL